MSKIILYQCDMCHNKSEDLDTYILKVPVVDFDEKEPDEVALERGGKPKQEFTEYDLCEDCCRKLKNFIETFHTKNDNQNHDTEDKDPDTHVWFVEYKTHVAAPWRAEKGPFLKRADAEEALNKSILLNVMYQYRVACRTVPDWVVDFIAGNVKLQS